MKILFAFLFLVGTAFAADRVKIHLPNEAVGLVNALVALDGVDRVVTDTLTGREKGVKVPYDFGANSVRVRLAIRKNLLSLRYALEAFDQSRASVCLSVFGVESMPPDVFALQSEAKRAEFNRRAAPLLEPVEIECELFTDADVTAFAAAGVPGSVSVALDGLVTKPKPGGATVGLVGK